MSQRKQQLEETLCFELHFQARSRGYTCAGIGPAGYARIHRMTCAQLDNEIARIKGIKTVDELPADHVCITVG